MIIDTNVSHRCCGAFSLEEQEDLYVSCPELLREEVRKGFAERLKVFLTVCRILPITTVNDRVLPSRITRSCPRIFNELVQAIVGDTPNIGES